MPEETFIGSNRSSAFVGREREVAELRVGLEDASQGRGRLFLVSGEPGIGKSRLTEEVAAHAAAGATVVLRAGCWEGPGAPAYWPFIQLIRSALGGVDQGQKASLHLIGHTNAPEVAADIAQLVPEFRPVPATVVAQPSETSLDAEQARFRLFDAVATMFRDVASARPLMLILEDLHEADEPSLSMLQFVVRQFKGSRVLVLATYRDFEIRRSPGRARLIGDLLREGTEVPLFGLSRQDTGRMIEARTGAPASPRILSDIHQATAGNPLFIDGLVRVLWADGLLNNASRVNLATFRVPNGVREAIRRWVDSLSNRSALVAAAAIGQQFDLRCLQLVVEHQAYLLLDTLREAAELGILLSVSNGVYRFSHALIRNALIDELSAAERASLHLRIGEVLEELYQPQLEAHLAELAHHFREGGDTKKAIDYSIRAGEAARQVFAYEEAAAHWQAALELIDQDAAKLPLAAALSERLGLAMYQVDRTAAVKHLESALRLYKISKDLEGLGRIHARLGNVDSAFGFEMDLERSLSHLREGERVLAQLSGDSAARLMCSIKYGMATTAARAMRIEEGLKNSHDAMEIAQKLDDPALWIPAATQHGLHLFYHGELQAAFQLLADAWQKADQLDNGSLAFDAIVPAGGIIANALDPIEAVSWFRKELSTPRAAKAPYVRNFLTLVMANFTMLTGQLTEADRQLSKLEAWDPSLDPFLGLQAFGYGEWEKALRLLSQLIFLAARGGRSEGYGYARFRPWIHRLLGHDSAARTVLEDAVVLCTPDPIPYVEMWARPALSILESESGHPEKAHPHLARCREVLASGEDWRGLAGLVAQAEAVFASVQRDFSVADIQFARALDIFRRYVLPFDEAETLRFWAIAQKNAAQSDWSEKLDQASQIYLRIGAGAPWNERIDADRRKLLPGVFPAASEKDLTQPSLIQAVPITIGAFRKDGDYWTVSWATTEFRLKHRKGFEYLVQLLRSPVREFTAHDLVFAVEGGPGVLIPTARPDEQSRRIARDLGDSGVRLDVQAKGQYRRRLAELREDLAEAERMNDIGRIERSRAEMEFIESEIAGAVGLSGRDRKATSHSERARLSVTKAIKSAILQIQRVNRDLGRHLGVSIRTGYLCVYRPERPVVWHL